MRYLLLLFLPLTAMAQGGVEQPFFSAPAGASATWAPTNLIGSRYWWVSSDNPTNTVITNWVDRVVSLPMTNDAAVSPTNSATGMGFDGSTYLKPTNQFVCITRTGGLGATGSVMIVFTPQKPAGSYVGLLGGNGNAGGRGFFTRSNTNLWVWGSNGNSSGGTFHPEGRTMDVIYTYDEDPSVPNTDTVYTNGVQSAVSDNGGWGANAYVGYDPTVGFYKGKILEIFWTSNFLDSTSISNLHWYATNTYKFSP